MIPSYDDLTPGIPDVVDSEMVRRLEIFFYRQLPPSRGLLQSPASKTDGEVQAPRLDTGSSRQLYACLAANGEPRTADRELRTADREPQTLLAIAQDFSPRVLRASDREILLDVSGLGRLIGDPPAIRRELRRAIADAGADAFVAIAPTQTAARLLAAARVDGAIEGSPDALIARLPVALLAPVETLPPAMNHRDRARPYDTFARWGIATLGDLAALPAAELSSRLGRRGVALQRLARGRDPRPFVPDPGTPRFMDRLELEWPIEALEPLSFVLARLLEPLSAALERADRGAAAIRLELRLTDRRTDARVLQLPAPMRDPRVLRTLLLLDLEANPPSAAIDIVAIELDPAPARITQFSLLARALPSPETLSTLTARLSALAGESRVGSAALIDSHAPDAFVMERFAPADAARDALVGAPGAAGASGAGATGAQGALVLRRRRMPPAIRVSVEQGRPVYLAPSRRGVPYGAIVQAAGPWRSSGCWWGSSAVLPPEGGSHVVSPWNRDEWDVALKNGAVCRIYQDRTTECWFLEGIYD